MKIKTYKCPVCGSNMTINDDVPLDVFLNNSCDAKYLMCRECGFREE